MNPTALLKLAKTQIPTPVIKGLVILILLVVLATPGLVLYYQMKALTEARDKAITGRSEAEARASSLSRELTAANASVEGMATALNEASTRIAKLNSDYASVRAGMDKLRRMFREAPLRDMVKADPAKAEKVANEKLREFWYGKDSSDDSVR